MPQVRIALAQLNCTVGDFDSNREAALEACMGASAMDANVIVFPEMFLTGYPVEDLALRPSFQSASRASLELLREQLVLAGLAHLYVVIGHLDVAEHDSPGLGRPKGSPQNVVTVLHHGGVAARYVKRHLPNYGVFDEFRYFVPGDKRAVFEVNGLRVGLAICEDLWQGQQLMADYKADGIDVLIVPNGSPFELDKDDTRHTLVRERASQVGCPIVYVNMVGGQDELVFDGGSFITHADGVLSMQLPQFAEEIAVATLDPDAPTAPIASVDNPDAQQVWQALVVGTRDYVIKNGASSVLLGLSGGIDSAVVASLACDALGASNVYAVSMPSDYSSQHSRDDAADLAKRTGLNLRTVPIAPMSTLFTTTLGLQSTAAENVQARVRGTTLMAISNSEGHLVLAPGNKSELAVGYSTVYGDTVGAYAPIKDVFKVMVWELARWRNAYALSVGAVPPIPESSITKAPSAELRPGQVDTDSLPDYEILDAILHTYVEQDRSAEELIAAGFDPHTVMRVLSMVDAAEWKRRQYPPGPKVSIRAFGRDRRLPITSAWRGNS
jgi:NAD+ synthase (glutamine-hydrolysing)